MINFITFKSFQVYDLQSIRGGKIVGSSFSRGANPGSRETFVDIENSDGSVSCDVKWISSKHNDGLGAGGTDNLL